MNEKRPITRRLAPGTIGLRALLGCLPVVGVVGPERASAEEKVQNRLTRLAVRESETATEIVISGSVAPTFAVFKLSDPIRLFVDISNADTQALESPVDLDNGVVGEVSALQFQDSQARVGRIIIGLQLDALYTVRAQGNDLVVTIDATQRRRKVVPIAAGSDSGATHAQMAAIEARVAEAEQRARGAESRARTLDEQGQSAIADARLAAKAAEEERGRAEAAVALAGRDAAAKVAIANTTAAATVALAKAQADAQRVRSEESSRRSQAEVEAASVARTKAEDANRRAQADVEAARAEAARDRAIAKRAATEKAEALAMAERARTEKVAAEAAAERAQANAVESRAGADRAAAEKASAQAAATLAARRADEAEGRARDQISRVAGHGRDEATALRRLAEKAASERVVAEQAAGLALTRAQNAEVRAQSAEADRARLKEELSVLDAQRQDAAAKMATLESAQAGLAGQLSRARERDDIEGTERLLAEQKARQAEVTAMRAQIVQLESAKASSAMDTRVKALQGEVDAARSSASAGRDEREKLQRTMTALTADSAGLRESLRQRESELQAARALARQQRDAADALPAVASVAHVAEVAPVVSALRKTRVTDVKFEDLGARSEIRVRFDGTPDYEIRNDGERTRILELKNTLIDAALERSLDTSDFESAIRLVSSFQAPGGGDRVRVVVTLGERSADRAQIKGQELIWSFEDPAARRTATPVAEVPYSRPSAALYTGPAQAATTIQTAESNEARRQKKKRYSGRKINIDIKDAGVHNVLRLLAKEGNVNIVTSDKVQGSVTVHLRMVPWDQALDLVLRSKQLDMVREGDIIRVGLAVDIADERRADLEASVVKGKLKPLNVRLISVNHAVAGDLISRVKSVQSDRGSVEYDPRTNTVILRDIDESLDAAEDLVRRLDTQTPQVMIEARIVEVNTNSEFQFGIQWGGDATWSAATGNPTGLRFPSVVGFSGAADDATAPVEGTASNPNFIVNMPAAIGSGSGGGLGLTFGSVDGTFNLNLRLSAAESRGQVKIVSSPKITTLDNNDAVISQGVSIPISQVSAAGVNTVFFDAVLSLKVKPHVTQDGNIYLVVAAENNTPDFQNVGARGDPTILKKTASTNVLLKDGDTTVIGGIYTSNGGYSQAEVPFFARIPILGALFRNYRESDRRTELLIFITPRIVNRAAASVRTAP